jgi:crossover junction endodeoxyribonuclease RuvC
MTTALGIDPSTKATGLVHLYAADKIKVPQTLFAGTLVPKKLAGIDRAQWIVSEIMERITEWQPDVIVIEGYSLNMKNASSVIPLVELGGLLRFCLKLDGLSWADPRASELKRFVTGKGNSDKDQVMLQVYKRWGFEPASNDIADAYGLAVMGLAYKGLLTNLTTIQNEVVGEMQLISN